MGRQIIEARVTENLVIERLDYQIARKVLDNEVNLPVRMAVEKHFIEEKPYTQVALSLGKSHENARQQALVGRSILIAKVLTDHEKRIISEDANRDL